MARGHGEGAVRRWWRVVHLAAGGAVTFALLGFVAPVAGADGIAVSFDASAVADGVVVTVDNPSIPLGFGIDATAPESRVRLTSLGESSAVATGPYLGDTLVGALFSLPGGQGVGGADYPFIAATSAGDDPKDVAAPGMSLHAESGLTLAAARAAIGSGVNGATAGARVERVYDGTRAQGESRTDALTLFDKLVLAGVRSTAETEVTDGGRRTNRASMTIGRITAQGLVITVPQTSPVEPGREITGPDLGYTDGHFFVVVPGVVSQRVPLSTAEVAGGLARIGVRMSVEQASVSTTGVVSPAITFSSTLPAPPANPLLNGPTPVSVTVGRAATSVVAHAESGGTARGSDIPSAGSVSGSAPDANGTAAAAPLGGVPAAGVAVAAAPPTISGAGLSARPGATERLGLERADLAPVYLAVVLAGLASVVVTSVVRATGVRFT
jgi:hypothetical protein